MKSTPAKSAVALVAGLIVAAAIFRVLRETMLPDLQNFAPLMAMAFCGGLLLPGLIGWILPLAALIVSDIALNFVLGYPVLSAAQAMACLCYFAAVASGRWLARREAGFFSFAGMLLANSIFFYLLTNSVSWLVEPGYAKNLAGLWQCLTVGLPGFPPTWTFFRNSLISDYLFAAAILAVWVLAAQSREARAAVARTA